MPGPIPKQQRRRRNQATIPTNELPAEGRKGKEPAVPAAYELGKAGKAWWKWAWKLPQATAWDAGTHYALARRAQLEDDLAEIDRAPGLTNLLAEQLSGALAADNPLDLKYILSAVERTMQKLKSLASGRTAVMKEMRELDNRFGLNPKSMADLRWSIEEAEPKAPKARAKRRKVLVPEASAQKKPPRKKTRR